MSGSSAGRTERINRNFNGKYQAQKYVRIKKIKVVYLSCNHRIEIFAMERLSLLRFLPVLSLLFFLPAALIAVGFIPFAYRMPLLILSFCLTVLYSFYRGFTLFELGFRTDNLIQSLKVNIVFASLFSVLLGLLFYFEKIPGPYYPALSIFVPFYLIVSSPLQEFLFRGFLFAEMRAAGVRSSWMLVLFSAFSFSFIHIIYGDWLTLALTFGIGLLWAGIYYHIPNLAGISVFHGVVGLLGVLAGIARGG